MLELDLEIARATFIIGIGMAAFIYERFRLLSGGTITGSYVAFMLLIGNWPDVVAWMVLTTIGVAVIKLVSYWLPLPKAWLQMIAILVPAGIHVALIELAQLPNFNTIGVLLVAGMYVTNGLTAYDLVGQGLVRTAVAVTSVVGLTLAIVLPLRALMISLVDDYHPIEHLFVPVNPVVVLVCILAAAAVRLGIGWGTGGIIGAVFFSQILNWESLLVIGAFTTIGSVIFRWAAPKFGLTPRQQFHLALMVGGLVSWFGIFWAERAGFSGASTPAQFAIEPLIVVGLIMMESVRHGLARSMGGLGIVLAMVVFATWLLGDGSAWAVPGFIAILVAVLAIWTPGTIRMVRGWRAARAAGEQWPVFS